MSLQLRMGQAWLKSKVPTTVWIRCLSEHSSPPNTFKWTPWDDKRLWSLRSVLCCFPCRPQKGRQRANAITVQLRLLPLTAFSNPKLARGRTSYQTRVPASAIPIPLLGRDCLFKLEMIISFVSSLINWQMDPSQKIFTQYSWKIRVRPTPICSASSSHNSVTASASVSLTLTTYNVVDFLYLKIHGLHQNKT